MNEIFKPLKNPERVKGLPVRVGASASVVFLTSPFARTVRRDWNILSAKLFYYTRHDRERSRHIRNDCDELFLQSDNLLKTARAMPYGSSIDKSWLDRYPVDLQVVHPTTAVWLRSLRRLDEAAAIFISAELEGFIKEEDRKRLFLPAEVAYKAFKANAMDIELPTAEELSNF